MVFYCDSDLYPLPSLGFKIFQVPTCLDSTEWRLGPFAKLPNHAWADCFRAHEHQKMDGVINQSTFLHYYCQLMARRRWVSQSVCVFNVDVVSTRQSPICRFVMQEALLDDDRGASGLQRQIQVEATD